MPDLMELTNGVHMLKMTVEMLAAGLGVKRGFTAGKAYLPGVGDTLILKGVPPGRGLSIALRAG